MNLIFVLLFGASVTLLHGCGGGGGSDDEAPDPQPVAGYDEREITPEGGFLHIVDEQGNSIDVVFPEDALGSPARVSLALVPDRNDFAIEARHVSAFEIKPYDLQIYRPVSVMVNYARPLAEIEKSLIIRENQDKLLIALADHEYFHSRSGEGEATRAYAYSAGLFAEGAMSLQQIESHLQALLDSQEIILGNAMAMANDDTCYTGTSKSIWDDWKEFGDAAEEYSRAGEKLQSGFDPNQEIIAQSVCDHVVDRIGQVILGKCIPKNICDPNYLYVISDALVEIRRCGIYSGDVHDEFYSRFRASQVECTEHGALDFQLSGREFIDYNDPPNTPYRSDVQYESTGIVPLRVEALYANGFADIVEDNIGAGLIPLYPLSGSGSYIRWPGSAEFEVICQESADGYLMIGVSGTRNNRNNYKLSINTRHIHGRKIQCPGEEDLIDKESHVRNRAFSLDLNPQNGYMGTIEAVDDPAWTINVELKLPK